MYYYNISKILTTGGRAMFYTKVRNNYTLEEFLWNFGLSFETLVFKYWRENGMLKLPKRLQMYSYFLDLVLVCF